MAPQQVQWGTITFTLDNEAFRKGFLAARRWYDEQGRYHFDEMGYENLPEYLGYLVGYLGGPLASDEAECYRKEQAAQEYLCSSVLA